MDPRKARKYLGIEDSHDIQHKNEKEKLKEYLKGLRSVWGTELSVNNKIEAVGSLAVPALRYSFGIVNWHQAELRKLDRKTRKLLTIHGQHHPKTNLDRLYVPRKQGGRDLMKLEEAQVVDRNYRTGGIWLQHGDALIQTVRTHQHNINSAVLQTAKCIQTELQRGTRQIKDSIEEKTIYIWRGKRMHGQFPRNLEEKVVDNEQSY